jgi:hypothetical protein
MKSETRIGRLWKGNQSETLLMAIPKDLGQKHGLDKPCYIIIESRSDGILIRKLET